MKTPKEFDYDLWIAEDGRYMVRVKATREECAVNCEVFRKLRAEEKRLRREMPMRASLVHRPRDALIFSGSWQTAGAA